jgi:hypothetical protein
VIAEIVFIGECFVAVWAWYIGWLGVYDQHVFLHVALIRGRFPANLAVEGDEAGRVDNRRKVFVDICLIDVKLVTCKIEPIQLFVYIQLDMPNYCHSEYSEYLSF